MTRESVNGEFEGLGIPASYRSGLENILAPSERILGWFTPDLDAKLHFRDSLLVLTDRRLLASTDGQIWDRFSHESDDTLLLRDKMTVGSIELQSLEGRRACWRFTIERAAAAHRFVDRFQSLRRDTVYEEEIEEERACPSCGEPLANGSSLCVVCAPPPALKSSLSLMRLSRFAKPRMAPILAGFVLTLASTAATLIPPYLTVPLLNNVLVPRQNFHQVKWYLLGLLAASILGWLLSWARTYVIAWVSERIAVDMRNQTYEHLQKLSLEYFSGRRTGDLLARLSSDTDRICNFLSINLLDFGGDVIMIVMTAVLLVALDPLLAAATLIPFPIIVLMVQRVRGRLRRSLQRGGRAWSDMTSVLADTIPGIRVVKAFAQEKREVQRFRDANDAVLSANDRVNTTWSFFSPIVNLLTQGGLLIIWAFGSWQVYQQRIEVGVLVGFQLLINRFYVRLESMSRMVQATQRAAASTQRLFDILDRTPTVAEPTKPVETDHIRGALELRDVGFRHGTRQILQGINLQVQPGEMIGLVGPSGAGKSTLVNLVCRFYDTAEGAILVDGVDIRSYGVSDYRRHIGIVLQEPFLFFGTVADNISYGKPNTSRAEIIEAARAARCHEFILRLPDGYDSIVGERGQSLSGGERQRISIARALLIDPKILILDEATSSVDTETEREIQEALDNLIRGRTTIAIAHRLSTLRKADRLVVLEKGRIAEIGGHHDLLQSPGMYARLHQAQVELANGNGIGGGS